LSRDVKIGGGNSTAKTRLTSVNVSTNETTHSSDSYSEIADYLPHNKLSELPGLVKKSRVTEIPPVLRGKKHLRRE